MQNHSLESMSIDKISLNLNFAMDYRLDTYSNHPGRTKDTWGQKPAEVKKNINLKVEKMEILFMLPLLPTNKKLIIGI